MGMAWIEVHQSLPNHKKTLVASDILDIPPVHFMGHLICFWLWALDNAPDGNLKGISARIIARAAQWDGDPQQFLNALLQAGFIDQVGDSYVIHDWYDYAGRLLDQRQHAAEQKRRHRELYNNKALIQAIRERDKDRCRYCGRPVNWKDRKGPDGATYDYVDPSGPTSLENVVVACRACNAGKGQRTPEEAGYVLLPPPTEYLQKSTQNLSKIKSASTITLPNLTLPNHTKPDNNNLLTCASPDDDARAGNGQSPAVNNPVDDVEAVKVTVQPDEQLTNEAGQDPGGSVEAEMVTATPGEQQAKNLLEVAGEKPNKPRPPFTSKKQEQLFDQFWQLYPRKKNKGQAERVWARLRPNDELFAAILAGLERAKASYDWQKEGGKYIPYPATWLNAKGWEDEYTPAEEVNRGNGTYQQSFIKPGVTKSLDEARRNRFAALYQNTEG
jgi:5-methylcytosine-specific restriction endonuclease McrA